MAISTQLAMAADFLTAFSRLPQQQQRRVSSMLGKFTRDSTRAGLNFERVKHALSPNVRSIRIDQGYRAIVQQAPRGNQHLLLWADKHDEAYAWAARHRCDINPETGAIQIYEPDPVPPERIPSEPVGPQGPFASLRQRQLMRLGVPEVMVAELRAAQGDGEEFIEAIRSRLPREAYEGLFYYLAGQPYEEIILEREVAEETVDTSDFSRALRQRDSLARFTVVDNQGDLEAMLNAPLEKWRVFLHPTQRTVAHRDWNGPVRLLGAAGTGKTVVAMHRARWLVRERRSDPKVLFVTFNRNLANDIRQNLRRICTDGELDRIDVKTLDAWTLGFLKRHRYDFRIQFQKDDEAWKEALSVAPDNLKLPRGFYETEWEQVVQAHGIESLVGYRRVSRVGRGTPLRRSARGQVWKVFEAYRQLLTEKGIRTPDDAYKDAKDLIRSLSEGSPYSSVVVDEAQDLSYQAFRLIRSLAPPGKNDPFITGDCHQRIYGSKVVLGRCGINIRGRSRKLRLNYRTTEQTRAWAARLLEGRDIDDLDGGKDDNRNTQSLTTGPIPLVRNFETSDAQARGLVEYLQRLERHGADLRDVCVVARTKNLRNLAKIAVDDAGIPSVLIRREGDNRHVAGVRIATIHRVKGLEFDRVVLVSANEGILPLSSTMRRAAESSETPMAETKERALVYVAASRAKLELLVLSYGTPSPILPDEGSRS